MLLYLEVENMRKASIRQNHRDFERNLDVLDQVAAKIVNGQIGANANEWNALAEGIALTLAGYWEEVVDEDFVDALNRDTSAYAGRVGLQLPKNLSRDICFGLLVGDGYLDFRDTGQIVGQAKRVLVRANNPFDHLTKTIRTSIDQFYAVRNYLAHRSRRAHRSYAEMLESGFGYQRVVKPGAFLRAKGESLNKPRLVFFLHRFREASVAIRKNAAF
ncbi:hypothetical protein AUC70_07815 [Methyloceanibacter stevinii]|uniref:RiboL-PSP-HEPN domain-containing protein n=1 Tax=Methyloceanibacter stevinii TaxID=1774970 RepID=A0A1E3VNK9_9HYPH|nr:hypothetical protein [Methyloceanibacter stevinii]ODR94536.1 hypothetical protein AUC70_07815 [Methyloceanibacter stevinii]